LRPKYLKEGEKIFLNYFLAQRSWLERDLQRGDLSFLTDFAFFRNRHPPSIVVDRLSERGFLAKTERGSSRMTLKGWIAILLRRTSAKSLK
jgi:hypothetical protein